MTYENMDKEIKQRVRAVEQDIPSELEESIMKELEQIASTPGPLPDFMSGKKKKTLLYVGALATAASLLLVVLLLVTAFPSLFQRERADAPKHIVEDGVFVDSAQVEGVPADTFIIDQKNPDITIVWIEKAQMTAKKIKG